MRLDTDKSAATTNERTLIRKDGYMWMKVVNWLGKAGELKQDKSISLSFW